MPTDGYKTPQLGHYSSKSAILCLKFYRLCVCHIIIGVYRCLFVNIYIYQISAIYRSFHVLHKTRSCVNIYMYDCLFLPCVISVCRGYIINCVCMLCSTWRQQPAVNRGVLPLSLSCSYFWPSLSPSILPSISPPNCSLHTGPFCCCCCCCWVIGVSGRNIFPCFASLKKRKREMTRHPSGAAEAGVDLASSFLHCTMFPVSLKR